VSGNRELRRIPGSNKQRNRDIEEIKNELYNLYFHEILLG
jgi:hypothetical protein